MMAPNEIHLWGKKVFVDKSPVVFSYKPSDDWLDHFEVLSGEWTCENGCLIGSERRSTAALIVTKRDFGRDILFSFTMRSVPPATRDLNALFYAQVNEERNWIGESYVSGVNGWYEHRSGIERDEADGTVSLYSSTALYKYETGKEIFGLDSEVFKSGEAFVYHAGTKCEDGKIYTAGGRVLGVTSTGKTLDDAISKSYSALENIKFEKMHYRHDIGIK